MNIIERWMQKLSLFPNALNANALQVPARLIDLGDNHNLRIVATSSLQQLNQSFVALSYVWGANQEFVLLSTTETALSTGFQVEKLPRTIQDAVTVTRRIGHRYLWVDALYVMKILFVGPTNIIVGVSCKIQMKTKRESSPRCDLSTSAPQ